MEFSISGNALKTFSRSIGCLARVGNELVVQGSPHQLALHTLNASRSAYQSITFKSSFFDAYTISGPQAQFSVLVKAVCSVLRTPIASIDHLSVQLPDNDASKVQWTLECYSGTKKTYWITCNIEPDIQHLSLDRGRFPSSLVVQPRNMNKLLGNFQSSLQEITIIATDPNSLPSDAASEIGGKAVEFKSYVDPTKDSDSLLHTQLWIDPSEEFLQYIHAGDPVDVTFSMKESKAFLTFCDGCEADMHLFFEKAGEPILMAPKFGLDSGSSSNFDATLVLATMLVSQLQESVPSDLPQAANSTGGHTAERVESEPQERSRQNVSEHPSDHTRIWSELSGTATKSSTDSANRPQAQEQPGLDVQRIRAMQISKEGPARDEAPVASKFQQYREMDNAKGTQGGGAENNGNCFSQRHPSNWVDAYEDEDDNDGDENEMCIQATPPYYEDH
ncbi:PREDICTED: cell cycle checkpoint control protein RAD9A isoform X2 [Tarenaya hassleriana]|uniref:cell cycle checkpoint control protein RAD9A isoform X2 n=1 Tax=Tarenaya hassleriana TaxID=28532 RepID=UPI00053C4556|nr:PREDICTED: cell cycle checkpoint control protein RAD9A isoform X2 [Tarenaya hassleriana]